MDIHKIVHDLAQTLKEGHYLHLPLFAVLIGIIKRPDKIKDELSDLGDLGDNVPATLIKSLSSRGGL